MTQARKKLLTRFAATFVGGAVFFCSYPSLAFVPTQFITPDADTVRRFAKPPQAHETQPTLPDTPSRVPLKLPAISNLAKLLSDGDAAAALGDLERALQIYRYAQHCYPNDSTALVKQAQILRRQAKLTQATLLAETAIEVNPNNYQAWTMLALLKLSNGDYSKAERAITNATQLNGNDLTALRLEADLASRRGDNYKADAAYRKILELDCANVAARTNLAAHLATADKLDEAIKLMEEGGHFSKESSAYFLELGLLKIQAGRLADAAEALKTARDLDPHNPEPFELLAIISGARGDWESAADYAQSFSQDDPNNPNAVLLQAWSAYGSGELHEAKSYADALVDLSPNFAGAYNLRGIVQLDLRRFKEAAADFQKSLSLAPNELAIQMNIIMTDTLTGKLAQASELVSKLAAADSSNESLRALAAYVFANSDQSGKAHEMAQGVLSVNPTDELAQISESRLLRDEQHYAQAVALLRAMAKQPNHQDSAFWYSELADALYKNKQYDEAAQASLAALQLAPQNQQAKRILAFTLLAEGNYDGALLYLREAVAKNPKDVELRLALGDAFLKKGDLDNAETAYSAAQKIAPQSSVPLTRLAEVARQQKRTSYAEELLRQAGRLQQ